MIYWCYQPSNSLSELVACSRFTVSDKNGLLSRSQREFYEKNGFLVIPGLIPDQMIEECRQRFLDIVNNVVDSGRRHTDQSQFSVVDIDQSKLSIVDIDQSQLSISLAGQILKMKDLSLKDRAGLSSERIFNKIQDFCWDPVLAKYIMYPGVRDIN